MDGKGVRVVGQQNSTGSAIGVAVGVLPRHYVCQKCSVVLRLLSRHKSWTESNNQPWVRNNLIKADTKSIPNAIKNK